jgi:hypothetical protein
MPIIDLCTKDLSPVILTKHMVEHLLVLVHHAFEYMHLACTYFLRILHKNIVMWKSSTFSYIYFGGWLLAEHPMV